MKKSLILFIVAVILGLSACSDLNDITQEQNEAVKYEPYEVIIYYAVEYFEEIDELTLNDIIDIANQRRQSLVGAGEERLSELIKRIEPPEELSDLSRLLQPPENRQIHITKEEAIHDAEVLLELLRYGYGAYAHFGGDEVFLPMFERIKEELSEREIWHSGLVGQVFANHLETVIADNHSIMFGRRMGIFYQFYVWETPFDLINNKFYHRETGRYVTEIVDYNINDVFRLAMDEGGNFFYIPIFEKYSNILTYGRYDFTFIFNDGSQEVVTLRNHTSVSQPTGPPVLHFINDIPIVSIKIMGHPYFDTLQHHMLQETDFVNTQEFLSFVDDLKDEPVIIIDIRSNKGGHGILAPLWLYLLTGKAVHQSYVIFIPFIYFNWENLPLSVDLDNPEYLISEEDSKFFNEFSQSIQRDTVISNDKLIIMLIDRHTMSAGEHFVDLLFNMENTLVIGQNTFGIGITSFPEFFYLPYSGVEIGIGLQHYPFPESHFTEGRGFAPDVWVIGDALTAALAIIQAKDS